MKFSSQIIKKLSNLGLNSGKSSPRNTKIADALLKKGIACFLFDYTGHGESEGAIADDFLAQQSDDLGCDIDFVTRHRLIAKGRIGVSGSSTGGSVAIINAATDKRIKALVLRAPVSEGLPVLAEKITAPVLIIQGDKDARLPENKELYEHLTCKKEIEIIPGADHLFEDTGHFRIALNKTVEWFVRWL